MIQLFGDANVNGLHRKMRCEKCNDRDLDVEAFQPVGSEFVGIRCVGWWPFGFFECPFGVRSSLNENAVWIPMDTLFGYPPITY